MSSGPSVDLSIGKGITTSLVVIPMDALHPSHPDHTLGLEIGMQAAKCWDPPMDPAAAGHQPHYLAAKAWWAPWQ